MTGAVLADPDPEPAHTRVRMQLGPAPGTHGARRLAFVDPRRFGTGELLLGSDALEAFFAARLGLEPFDEGFTAEHLRALAKGGGADQVSCWTSAGSPASATSTPMRRCSGRASTRCRPAGRLAREQYARLARA